MIWRGQWKTAAAIRSGGSLDDFTFKECPEYEETTKRRQHSTEAGYLVCALSTLMWTPFSPSCSKCAKAEPCRRRTQARYPELYRIRCEAWRKKEAKP